MSSNLTRSTKTFQTLTVPLPAKNVLAGVQLESKPYLMHGQPWAPCGFLMLPTTRPSCSMRSEHGQCGHRVSRLLFAGDDNILFPIQESAHRTRRPDSISLLTILTILRIASNHRSHDLTVDE